MLKCSRIDNKKELYKFFELLAGIIITALTTMKSTTIFTVSCVGLLMCLSTFVAANTPRTCYSCQGIGCAVTSIIQQETCIDPLDYCVTVFKKFNVVQKGCSMGVPIELRKLCDANTPECHKCSTDRCNNLGALNYVCLQCDSSKDSKCSQSPTSIAGSRCASPTAPNSYCYVKYENGSTKRGCSGTVTKQMECFKNANCMLCSPGDIRNCNAADFKAGTRAFRL